MARNRRYNQPPRQRHRRDRNFAYVVATIITAVITWGIFASVALHRG